MVPLTDAKSKDWCTGYFGVYHLHILAKLNLFDISLHFPCSFANYGAEKYQSYLASLSLFLISLFLYMFYVF